MPPGQDDNPFGTPRGAWGRQPPTTFALSSPVRRTTRASTQIRLPIPVVAPRGILTGGVISPAQPGATPDPVLRPDPIVEPSPVVEPPPQVSDSVLARASAAPKAPGLAFPPVAGIGLLIAAAAVAGWLLLRGEPAPAPEAAAIATPSPAPPASPELRPVAQAPSVTPPAPRAARSAPTPRRAAAPVVTAPDPTAAITPPPLTPPPVFAAPAPPPPAAAIPLPTDPEIPMTTRAPD